MNDETRSPESTPEETPAPKRRREVSLLDLMNLAAQETDGGEETELPASAGTSPVTPARAVPPA